MKYSLLPQKKAALIQSLQAQLSQIRAALELLTALRDAVTKGAPTDDVLEELSALAVSLAPAADEQEETQTLLRSVGARSLRQLAASTQDNQILEAGRGLSHSVVQARALAQSLQDYIFMRQSASQTLLSEVGELSFGEKESSLYSRSGQRKSRGKSALFWDVEG